MGFVKIGPILTITHSCKHCMIKMCFVFSTLERASARCPFPLEKNTTLWTNEICQSKEQLKKILFHPWTTTTFLSPNCLLPSLVLGTNYCPSFKTWPNVEVPNYNMRLKCIFTLGAITTNISSSPLKLRSPPYQWNLQHFKRWVKL